MIDFKKYHLEITNKKAIQLIHIFINIAFIFCIIGIITLWFYNWYYPTIYLYKSSLILFRTGILIEVSSIICGIFFSNYEYLK